MARILIVDDDKDIRDLACALLIGSGHAAFAVSGALDAVEFLGKHTMDLVITDANMPLHSGFDLVKTLRKDANHAHLPIVMLTGRRESRDVERASEAGVNEYIIKPIDPLVFTRKIVELLDRSTQKRTDLPEIALRTEAKLSSTVELMSLSEVGLLLRSKTQFADSTRVELETDLFDKIGIEAPFLRVLSSVEKEGYWETRVGFTGADQKTLMRIRSWIHINAARSRAA